MIRMSVGKKISLGIGFFLFPVMLLGYFFYSEKQILIEFTEKEVAGIRYIKAAHRALIAATSVTPSSSALNDAIATLSKADTADAGYLGVTDTTAAATQALKAAASGGDVAPAAGMAAGLISTLSDRSNITLDPDGDAYFIGDISVNQAPGLFIQSAALVHATQALANDASDANKAAFTLAMNGLQTHATNLRNDLAKALANNSDGSLAQALEEDAKALDTSIAALVSASQAATATDVSAAATQMQSKLAAFVERNNAEMERLLTTRIDGFHQVILSRLGISALAVLIGTLLFVLIIRSILRDEKQRAESTRERAARIKMLTDAFEAKAQIIASTVAASSTELAHTASLLREIVDRTMRGTKSATDNSTEINLNVQTVATAIEQMSIAVREIAVQTSKTDQLVGVSKEKTIVADEQAVVLADAARQVSETVNLISSIAEKINLLALNATIESARAGDAGRGFAVVASEVKNLADQTNKSVDHVRSIIVKLNEASGTVATMVNTIRKSVEDTSEASSSIAAAVEEQSAVTTDITHNMQTAARGAQEITQNLGTLNTSAVDASAASEQVLTAAKELSLQSEMLNQEVSGFLNSVRAA